MANTFTHERIGPMARNTHDLAVLLDHLTGIDGGDLVTMAMLPHARTSSYTTALAPSGLRGARVGVLREMFRSGPAHAEGLALTEKAVLDLHRAGAVVLDPVLLGLNLDRTRLLKVNYWESNVVLDRYFADFGPNAPFRSVREMVAKFPDLVKPSFAEYLSYAPGPDPEYQGRLAGRAALRAAVVELMDRHGLEAVVFPYKTLPAQKRNERGEGGAGDPLNAFVRDGDRVSPSDNYLSSMTGLPGLVVPMGYTADGAPLGLEFLGRPFSEATLIKLASGYEATTRHRSPPASTPALPGEKFTY
jgi:Asp-tRNA(Asn)/Glu-tRNA(Gln) amidotransferase A subunit family amidase